MKAIENGVVQRVSPSMLTSFDAKSAFGCARRGFYKYVMGLKEPTTAKMTQGTELHALNEAFLKLGVTLPATTPQQESWFKAGLSYVKSVLEDYEAVAVEQPMPAGFSVEGITVSEMSKCDVVAHGPAAIIDWKTTSSIEKYGKTPGQLAVDTQMLIYAKAFHTDAPEVTLTHGQYQTEGKPLFRASSVKLVRNELDDNYGRVILPLVATVREVAKQKEAKDVAPNRSACRMCPHRAICPPDKENPLMSIFNKWKMNTTSAAPAAPADTGVPAPQIITPPDAPKSDPALAAKPVEGFSPVPPPRKMKMEDVPAPAATAPAPTLEVPARAPEAKRGPGRPPGAKNKATLAKETAPTAFPSEAPAGAIVLESVTVSYGLTVNMGDFNSVRIDVGMTARHGGDADKAYSAVMDIVKAKVESELVKLKGGSK